MFVKSIGSAAPDTPGPRSCNYGSSDFKEGNGKEIRCLHDLLLQHYIAIKALDPDNFGETLLTVFIELLDPTTYYERLHGNVPAGNTEHCLH